MQYMLMPSWKAQMPRVTFEECVKLRLSLIGKATVAFLPNSIMGNFCVPLPNERPPRYEEDWEVEIRFVRKARDA